MKVRCQTDKKILWLALPSIVSNITVPLLGLCDVAIMGHVGGAMHIGAIAVGSMIFNVMYWMFVCIVFAFAFEIVPVCALSSIVRPSLLLLRPYRPRIRY